VCDESVADIGAGAAFVLDDDLLVPDFGELFGDDPRIYVGRTARRKRHDHMNGSIRPRRRSCRANEARRQRRYRAGCDQLTTRPHAIRLMMRAD
jgi:hypothetical protein